MLRPLEDNRQRGIVNNELQHIAQQLEKKFIMCGIECDDEMTLFRCIYDYLAASSRVDIYIPDGSLCRPKLREMEALNEELYEQVNRHHSSTAEHVRAGGSPQGGAEPRQPAPRPKRPEYDAARG